MQEVTDAEGRRRFHGAFTGGYSAGYYNTVGSLEGWAPSTFKSSREDRGSARYSCYLPCYAMLTYLESPFMLIHLVWHSMYLPIVLAGLYVSGCASCGRTA